MRLTNALYTSDDMGGRECVRYKARLLLLLTVMVPNTADCKHLYINSCSLYSKGVSIPQTLQVDTLGADSGRRPAAATFNK